MKKSGFKVGKKVFIKTTDEIMYMYSLTTDDKFVVCTTNPLGYAGKRSIEYEKLSNKPSRNFTENEKKYNHSFAVVEVFKDVEALFNLLKENPTYKDTIVELMNPYVGNGRYWDFVLHTAADNPGLQNAIKRLLIHSKE